VLQITPQMRILVALEAVDGRKGIDSLVQLCREKLLADPFSGCLFVFRSRRATSIRVLPTMARGSGLPRSGFPKGDLFGGRADPERRVPSRLIRRNY
jgi:transposase